MNPGRALEPPLSVAPQPAFRPFSHPLICLAAVSLAFTAALHRVFYLFAPRIWASGEDVPPEALTSWTRWAISERDGIEPQVLLLLGLVALCSTVLAMSFIERLRPRLRELLTFLCLAVAALFAWRHPPLAPMAEIDPSARRVLAVVAATLLLAVGMRWAARRRGPVQIALALFLVPVCFVAISLPSYVDLSCILAPALRLRHGFAPSQIYFQYDYLLSLLAVGWHRLGGDPYAFSFVTQLSFYLLLLACFLLARRLYHDPRLAGSLLVALCAVRVYAVIPDVNVYPQVSPFRIDLWILLLTPALLFGLRHWSVGAAAAIVFFFGRSFGILYLGSYALAIGADFLARRSADSERLPLSCDAARLLRELAPALLWIAAGLIASRFVFGAVVSDAIVIYRRLGIGMMRTSPASFFWWIVPMLAATAWLVFSLYPRLPGNRAGAALFAIALAFGNLIYFFGRSHEHNLLNVAAPVLLCAFLGIDLACLAWSDGPRWTHRTLQAAPWVVVLFIAFFYSGRLAAKAHIQAARLLHSRPVNHFDDPGVIACSEISTAAKDRRVFVFSSFDYWFYERCGYVPPGYLQPLVLLPLRSQFVERATSLLDAGYKIVVPKPGPDALFYKFDFAEIQPELGAIDFTETPHYYLYRRKPV